MASVTKRPILIDLRSNKVADAIAGEVVVSSNEELLFVKEDDLENVVVETTGESSVIMDTYRINEDTSEFIVADEVSAHIEADKAASHRPVSRLIFEDGSVSSTAAGKTASRKPTRIFTCRSCFTAFENESSYKRHVSRHQIRNLHKCDMCQKSFHSSTDLRNHVMMHRGERPYTCDICGHSFTVLSNLRNHRLRHEPEKYVGCELCDKKFAQPASLRKHMQLHSGDRPYPCNICGKQFQRVGDLNRHVSTHSGARKFTCAICLRGFSLKSNLKHHMLKTHQLSPACANDLLSEFPTRNSGAITQKDEIVVVEEILTD